jgi:hypothetical protein
LLIDFIESQTKVALEFKSVAAKSDMPAADWLGRAQQNYTSLALTVHPGAAAGSTVRVSDSVSGLVFRLPASVERRGAAERRHPAGREKMGSPTHQTIQ